MTERSATQNVLLVLSVPVALEDSIVDWLLAQSERIGFSSAHIRGHGSREGRLSLAEQVAGHQRRGQVHGVAPPETAPAATAALKTDFAGSDLFYWIMPVLEAGHVTPGPTEPA